MSNYVMVIQYDGGRYDGWQRMGNERSDNTVQGKIAEVFVAVEQKKVFMLMDRSLM